jgi:hypothetical protein
MNYDSNKSDTIIQAKDNGVYSAWNYASKAVGGKKRKRTRKYRRGKINKGRRTRRT